MLLLKIKACNARVISNIKTHASKSRKYSSRIKARYELRSSFLMLDVFLFLLLVWSFLQLYLTLYYIISKYLTWLTFDVLSKLDQCYWHVVLWRPVALPSTESVEGSSLEFSFQWVHCYNLCSGFYVVIS